MNNVVTVNFHGAQIVGLRHSGIVYIAVKPIVEGMGLSWGSQLNRIRRDPILSKGVFKMNIPLAAGGPQDHVCLTLKRIAGWLFTINSNQIKDLDVRSRVLLFQEECYDVLEEHFLGSREKREIGEAESLNLRLVTESRHVHGPRAADQLWKQLGLPRVPAMDEAYRDLFNWQNAA
jgi:hypothetical protein